MAQISLRAYIREIEGIVDHGQFDQAIAHCKHILVSYPKHLDTYRLLGKSYLEAQRYREAADIFQRVLSVVPDDFVAQIGMSIIREDEENLDAAIFHMERAFEVQPSTSTVQDELRRLYGKRDGAEPPKVRLTRGALVRMYPRSELYPQAIAEIRAALSETPERVDLESILTKMYHLSGQKTEAVELAGMLIQKLPYCLEANKILADVVSSSPQTQDIEIYKNRINAIDPYNAFLSPSTPSPLDIPENAVMIEKMQTGDGTTESVEPAWSQISSPQAAEIDQSLPDWLAMDSEVFPEPEVRLEPKPAAIEEQHPVTPQEEVTVGGTDNEELKEGAPIPDWMKSLGWAEAGKSDETLPQIINQGVNLTEEIAPADIPNWLQSLALTGEDLQPNSAASENHQPIAAVNPNLEDLRNSIALISDNSEEENASAEDVEPIDLPEWLIGDSKSERVTASSTKSVPSFLEDEGKTSILPEINPTENEQLPDWFKTGSEKTEEPVNEVFPNEATTPNTNPPDSESRELDWLQSLKASPVENQEESVFGEMQPSSDGWVKEEALESPEQPIISKENQEENLPVPNVETDLPDWLKDSQTNTQSQGKSESSVPDWLEGLKRTEEISSKSEPTWEPGDLPEWLVEARENSHDEKTGTVVPASLEESAPEWLIQIPESGEPIADASAPIPETLIAPNPEEHAEPLEELPAWLKSIDKLATKEPVVNLSSNLPEPVINLEETPIEDLSAWLKNLDTSTLQQPAESIAPESVAPVDETSILSLPQEETSDLPIKSDQLVSENISRSAEMQEISALTIFPELVFAQPESTTPSTPEIQIDLHAQVNEVVTSDNIKDAGPTPELSMDLEYTRQPEIPISDRKLTSKGGGVNLQNAFEGLGEGDIHQAIESYQQLIRSGKHLQETIESIRDGLYRYPVDIGLWQTLGDALARNKQLKEALEAYTKAEELLR